MPNLPKAVLFDFDGVVVNSFKVHCQAWGNAFFDLFKKDIPPFPKKSHEGRSPMEIALYFCETQNKPELAKELFDLKGKYLHNTNIPPELLPGIKELANFLIQKKIPFGIASNATKQFVGNSINQLNIPFETFSGFEDYTNPKPHPEPYIKLAEKLGIKKSDFDKVWVLEDSSTGLKAAKNAGMIPIGMLTHNSEQKMIENGAIHTFSSAQGLLSFLNK